MYIQSLWSRVVSQVRLVRRLRRMKVVKVVKHADRVPRGMFLPGDLRSPDRLAPAMIPVTPENKTAKTVKKSTLASGFSQSWL